jgi:hypothetical protein
MAMSDAIAMTFRPGVLLGLLLLGAAGPSGAQESRFDVGVMAGLHRAALNGDPIPETSLETRSSFLIGARLGMRLRDDLSMSVEPCYARRGANAVTVVDDVDDIEETTRIDLDYLDVPMLIRVHGSGKTRPYAVGGLGVGFLLDATGEPPAGGAVDLTDELNGVDVFACFGGGLETTIAGQELLFEARYTQGLGNVNDGDSPGASVPGHFKNTALQFVASWKAWRP